MGCITYLTDVCTFLGDQARATTLYQLLLPFAGRTVVIGFAAACYGAVSRYLGALATTLERWDEAAQHFEDALAMNARMEARPWLAHTQYQYATMLLARDQAGDSSKAQDRFLRKPGNYSRRRYSPPVNWACARWRSGLPHSQ